MVSGQEQGQDDGKGALIYDTYIIEELRCEGNKGLSLLCQFET